MRFVWFLSALTLLVASTAQAAFTFTPGHYYSSNYFSRVITEYNSAGTVVGSLTVPSSAADEIRGITFGPDGLLYATAIRGSGFNVLAMNSAGAIQKTYTMPNVYAFGNLSFGKLAVDSSHIYVAAANQLTRFDVGNSSSGTSIYGDNQLYDVNLLSNGNLLVATAYYVREITPAGSIVNSVAPIGNYFTDIRGLLYDSSSGKVFVTHLGHSDFFFRLMRIDRATNVLEKDVTFSYADDLFLTDSGNLLVGSRTDAPRFYDRDLNYLGSLGTTSQMFITELVPEPAMPMTAGMMAAAMLRRRRQTGGFTSAA